MKLILRLWADNPPAAAAVCPAPRSGAAQGAGRCLEVMVGPRGGRCVQNKRGCWGAGGFAEGQERRAGEMGRVQENGRKLRPHWINPLALPIRDHLP